jgi:hypothetical protein
MIHENDNLINLAIHESSDPEMLKRDAESKTGSAPNSESSNSNLNSSKPELLRQDSDSGIASKPEDFSYEHEEDRENPPQPDFDLPRDDKLAADQIMITNLHAG